MGFQITKKQMNEFFSHLQKDYNIYAPKRFIGGGAFSDTDCIRYGEIKTIDEAELNEKSQYSFKEVLVPISQTLFFFTENTVKEADAPKKGAVILLRSCDLHALKRLDDIYLDNGPADHYYKRLRKNIRIILLGCSKSCENGFCVSMGTNISDNYDLSIDCTDDGYMLDCKNEWFETLLNGNKKADVTPASAYENNIKVNVPDDLTSDVAKSSMWNEYDSRCINCGRCNFVCPTCSCYTMQDVFYRDNGKVGERRRVWASCMVDGFTDVAGGGSYRKKNGERMRFKVLHKVLDHKKRSGHHMCVGCGRCDDSCPEYISFSNCINKLEYAMKEVNKND